LEFNQSNGVNVKDHEGIHHDQSLFRSPETCKQVFNFTTGVELHKQLACSEMPVSLFLQAVYLAQKEKKKGLDFESYPSVRLLCDWWDECNPGRSLPAAFFYLHIRVEDNNIYFAGYGETPASYVCDDTRGAAPYSARVGNFIIIEFFASIPTVYEGDCCYYATSVNGEGIGDDLGYIPNGFPHGSWDTWHSLREFPSDFPALFNYFQFAANREVRSEIVEGAFH
jgi:hypothetical protein